jgi:beta-phosphoglucomutase family hydrolase
VPPTTPHWPIPQRPGATFEAALFDLDGVITPTAGVHMAAWRRTFTEYFDSHRLTPRYTDADYFDYVDGKPRYDGVRACLQSRGVTLPDGSPDDEAGTETVCGVGNAKNDAFITILRDDGVDPYPGSVALMDFLDARGVPMAIVSSSRNAPEVLRAAGIAHRFDVVVDGAVTAERGLAGKPAPDAYEYAAELLGVSSASSVVVEDATSGVAAGAAGDFGLVVGVDRGAGAAELLEAGADIVVGDLSELVAR